MFELLFAFYLVIVMPARALWRSFRPRPPGPPDPPAPRLRGYWRRGRYIGLLLAVLCAVEWQAGRTLADLGLDIPLSRAGAWGLIGAVGVLTVLHVAGLLWERRMTPAARAAQARKLEDGMPWPVTRAETAGFVAWMVLMCTAWEVLYRGFLLLVLAPLCGVPLATVAAALAYGAGHGYKSRAQFIGAIVSAFVFTLAYVWTGSLWWLILIHVVMPLAGLWGVRRVRRLGLSAQAA
jgi:membrane protease YdiL (CAAX protease family)